MFGVAKDPLETAITTLEKAKNEHPQWGKLRGLLEHGKVEFAPVEGLRATVHLRENRISLNQKVCDNKTLRMGAIVFELCNLYHKDKLIEVQSDLEQIQKTEFQSFLLFRSVCKCFKRLNSLDFFPADISNEKQWLTYLESCQHRSGLEKAQKEG